MIPKLLVKKISGQAYDLFRVLYPCHPFIVNKYFIIPIFANFFTKPSVSELTGLQLSKTCLLSPHAVIPYVVGLVGFFFKTPFIISHLYLEVLHGVAVCHVLTALPWRWRSAVLLKAVCAKCHAWSLQWPSLCEGLSNWMQCFACRTSSRLAISVWSCA